MRMITIMEITPKTPKMPPINAPAIGPIAKELPEAAVGGVGPVVGCENNCANCTGGTFGGVHVSDRSLHHICKKKYSCRGGHVWFTKLQL